MLVAVLEGENKGSNFVHILPAYLAVQLEKLFSVKRNSQDGKVVASIHYGRWSQSTCAHPALKTIPRLLTGERHGAPLHGCMTRSGKGAALIVRSLVSEMVKLR